MWDCSGGLDMWNCSGGLDMWDCSGGLDMWDCSGGLDMWDCSGGLDMWDCSGRLDMWDCSGGLDMWDCSGGLDMWDCSGGLAWLAARIESTRKIETASRGYKYVEVSEVFLIMWPFFNFMLRCNGFLFVKSVNYNIGFDLSSVLRITALVGKKRGETRVW